MKLISLSLKLVVVEFKINCRELLNPFFICTYISSLHHPSDTYLDRCTTVNGVHVNGVNM